MRFPRRRLDWDRVIERVNERGHVTVLMGSPGSAQVTRVRLLRRYRGLRARTEGSLLRLWLA